MLLRKPKKNKMAFSMYTWIILGLFSAGGNAELKALFKGQRFLLLPFDICTHIQYFHLFVFVFSILPEFYAFSLAKDQFLPVSGIPALIFCLFLFVFSHFDFSKNCWNESINPLSSEVNPMQDADLKHIRFPWEWWLHFISTSVDVAQVTL